jgi:hypothetical protein
MRLLKPTFLPWLRTGHSGISVLRQVALLVVVAAVFFGCGATTNVASQEGGGNATPTASSSSQGSQATPTNTVTSAQPTATKAPTPPKIAGSYGGHYTSNAKIVGAMPLQLQISQSGSSLSGTSTEREGSVVTSDTGTIALNGSFTLTEKQGGVVYGILVGSILGSGHLGGAWNDGGATLGTWDVYNPPTPVSLYGSYSGSYTTDGSTGSNPMSLSLNQSGWTLTGTTTEGSTTYNDTGTLTANGSLTINEGGPVLTGGITDYGQLSGTWTGGGGSVHGTWVVNLLLI